MKKLFGREHGNTARSFWNIGDVHYRKGDYNEALDYFKKAKEVQDGVLDQDHSDKVATQNSIDLANQAKGNATRTELRRCCTGK
jgi:tetratricopeptide (TPR) repeat protein